MKANWKLFFLSLVLGASLADAQITWDVANSTWGSSSAFYGGSGSGQTDASTDGSTVYGASTTSGTQFLFGFANTTPTVVADYNLSGRDLSAGTDLHLVFTGLSAAPKYVAYTGGALTSYTYSSGTLTLNVSTVDPVASANDTAGTTLGSVFGMIIETGGSLDFKGSVFRSDMFWKDIAPLNSGYSGTSPLTGLNANGQNTATATFYAYLPTAYLSEIGINSPADAEAIVQKSDGTNITLSLTNTIYAPTDPSVSGTYTYGGASTLDFAGGGVDAYTLAQYANSSWSQGNIGLNAIPEPATYAFLFGSLALLTALGRRRAKNNVPMR